MKPVYFLILSFVIPIIGCNKSENPDYVTDIDGNIYHTVTIGTQVWMVENLKTTKYNDGVSIPLVTEDSAWENISTPGYSWYCNNANAYKNKYGALYNWFAVNTGKLAPDGWHIPTDSEWKILIDYLGEQAGGKMKSTGTVESGTGDWYAPNNGATNESGFSAVPGGIRGSDGASTYIHIIGHWWSSSEQSLNKAWFLWLKYDDSRALRYPTNKSFAFSVRCVKD